MAKKYLQLEDIRAYYDGRTGSVRVISKDPRLAGAPFQFNLPRNSETAETVIALLKQQGAISSGHGSLPDFVALPIAEGRLQDDLLLALGVGMDGKEIAIDFANSPHVAIFGGAGMGKTVLLSSLMAQIERISRNTKIYCYSEKPDIQSYVRELGLQTQVLNQQYQLLEILEELLDSTSQEHYSGNAYLMIDELGELSPSGIRTEAGRLDDRLRARILAKLENLLRIGRSKGIYVIATMQRPDLRELSPVLDEFFYWRVLMGIGQPLSKALALGTEFNYSDDDFTAMGRGVVAGFGSPQIFQAYWPEPKK